MKILKTLLLLIFVFSITSPVFAGDSETYTSPSQYKLLPDSVADTGDSTSFNNEIHPNNFQKVNMSCGIPPIPPIGCQVGACVCDQNGKK